MWFSCIAPVGHVPGGRPAAIVCATNAMNMSGDLLNTIALDAETETSMGAVY